MSMKELTNVVEQVTQIELDRANKKFPLFNSRHEGYAVIKEELEETKEALETLESSMDILWNVIRGKEIPTFITEINSTKEIYTQAVEVAAEAIQTAAMILKYDMSLSDEVESGGTKYE